MTTRSAGGLRSYALRGYMSHKSVRCLRLATAAVDVVGKI